MSRTVAMSRFAPATLRMQNSFLGASAPSLTERRRVTRELSMPAARRQNGLVGAAL